MMILQTEFCELDDDDIVDEFGSIQARVEFRGFGKTVCFFNCAVDLN